jgi:hypothetical protein
MIPIYKASMSVDELAAERLIQLAEERSWGARSLAVIPREGEAGRPAPPGRAGRGSSVAPWDDPGGDSGSDEPGEEPGTDDPGEDGEPEAESDDAEDPDLIQDGDDGSVPEQDDPTFVRPGRPLKR